MFEVINVETGESHGKFETLERAKGCVEFDNLFDWEIWDEEGTCIAWGLPR